MGALFHQGLLPWCPPAEPLVSQQLSGEWAAGPWGGSSHVHPGLQASSRAPEGADGAPCGEEPHPAFPHHPRGAGPGRGVPPSPVRMERGTVPQVGTFAGHHGPRLKALVAGALEASHHVGAGAVPTGIANGALVRVWGAQQRVEEEDGEGLGWALAGRALKLSQQSRQGREGAGEQ